MQSPHTQSYNLMRHHWAPAYSQTALVSDINSVREKLRLRLFISMCVFAFVQYESMPIWAREWRCLSYCSAVMYPSSCGVHCTPATSTLPSSSEKDRPRFRPWMVTSVPPSRGPATGLTYIGCRKKWWWRKDFTNIQWWVFRYRLIIFIHPHTKELQSSNFPVR